MTKRKPKLEPCVCGAKGQFGWNDNIVECDRDNESCYISCYVFVSGNNRAQAIIMWNAAMKALKKSRKRKR